MTLQRTPPAAWPRPDPPPAVVRLVEALEGAGHETWCVGGGVRDAMLSHPSQDWDLATAATPAEVQRIFRRVVPVGIEHGTVGVLDTEGRLHEVTTFRRDVRTDGRHAEVAFGVSLDDDLARRDFTINAIAWHPLRLELRDPFDGAGDLARGVLRAVGDPTQRMREDRLRALRAIRFASRYGFSVDPATWAAVRESAPALTRLSMERVRQELEKTMEQVTHPGDALERWRDAGALQVLLPSLAAAPAHALRAADALGRPGLPGRPGRRLNRFSAVFAELGSPEAERAARHLRMSNADVSWIGAMARGWKDHGTSLGADLCQEGATDAGLRRLAAAMGRTRVLPFLRVCAGLWGAIRRLGEGGADPAAVRRTYRRVAAVAWRDPIELADLAVDGEDLQAAGVPAGPAIGHVLRGLLAVVLEDPTRNTREHLLAAVPGVRGAAG